MIITLDKIKNLNPCADRFNNLISKYPDFKKLDLKHFLGLDDITYKDKIWVISRLMTSTQKVKWSIACAYSVLHIFESRYPKDKRPRKVFEFLSKFEDPASLNSEDLKTLRRLGSNAAHAAADAAYAAYAAYAAAHAAAHAAADAAAHAAADAAYAAYAAAHAAAYAAAYAATARETQEDLNLILAYDIIVNTNS